MHPMNKSWLGRLTWVNAGFASLWIRRVHRRAVAELPEFP